MQQMRSGIAKLGAVLSMISLCGEPSSAQRPPTIYLAGPLGFSESGRDFKDRVLIPQLTGAGYTVVDPFSFGYQARFDAIAKLPSEARRGALQKLDMEIGHRNRSEIDGSDAVLAVLD